MMEDGRLKIDDGRWKMCDDLKFTLTSERLFTLGTRSRGGASSSARASVTLTPSALGGGWMTGADAAAPVDGPQSNCSIRTVWARTLTEPQNPSYYSMTQLGVAATVVAGVRV